MVGNKGRIGVDRDTWAELDLLLILVGFVLIF
jgi:hypothetical protein